jgi:hypothetical protein
MHMFFFLKRRLPIFEGPLRVQVRCMDAHAVSSDAVIAHARTATPWFRYRDGFSTPKPTTTLVVISRALFRWR